MIAPATFTTQKKVSKEELGGVDVGGVRRKCYEKVGGGYVGGRWFKDLKVPWSKGPKVHMWSMVSQSVTTKILKWQR